MADNILLLIIIFCISMQTVTKKIYNTKTVAEGKYFFSAVIAITAMLFFIVNTPSFSFCTETIFYSLLFAICYGVSSVCLMIAISSGPLSITALICSYSLLIPTLYGLAFLHEPIGLSLLTGIILLLISLYLIGEKNNTAPITAKWVVCICFAFLGNGMCSVVQKMQQTAFQGAYKNEFMIVALLFVSFFLGILSIVKERKQFFQIVKPGLPFGILCGILNGIVNLFVIVLMERFPVSFLLPAVNAGDIALTYIISKVFFKEQLSRRQFCGFCIGVLSIILLNL